MTNDKAREYFSAYHEGTLESGLRASVDRKLKADASLKGEYEAFAATVASLDTLRDEPIAIPFYLETRIADRLEAAQAPRPAPFWAAWLAPRSAGPRAVWATGLAATALVAIVGLRGMSASGVGTAGIVSGSDGVRYTPGASDVVVSVASGPARTVTVDPEGGDAESYALAAGQPLELTLKNPNRKARRFKITFGSTPFATVAVPGNAPAARRPGSGTVSEFASAIADAYRLPVVVKDTPIGHSVRWTLESADARIAAEEGLGGKASASLMDGNVLQIGG